MEINTSNTADRSEPSFTTRAQEVVVEQNQLAEPKEKDISPKDKKRFSKFLKELQSCKTYRRRLIQLWSLSIDYRRGKPFSTQSDEDTIAVNLDWALTKTKQASLYSQTPQVRVNHFPETLGLQWLGAFERSLNDNLVTAGIEAAMDECLPDCINASGFGAVLVSYEAITENVDVPSIDMATLPPQFAAEAMRTGMLNGEQIPMTSVPNTIDHRYIIQRISPADLLWPIKFTGSDFDRAPWIGHSGHISWAEAVQRFGLKEEDKQKYTGENRNPLDRLVTDVDREKETEDMVEFDEIFYKVFQHEPDAKSFEAIWHLVFINGKEIPILDEPWKGQDVIEETNTIVGSRRYPIRILTLAYLSDEAIPPSDSAIGRPQINELNKIRTLYIRQRERNIPVRWVDINRTDPAILQTLMRGTWQHFIPVQGEGTRIIGEIAKAGMPPDDFALDRVAKTDLSEVWTIGPNQLGSGAEVETKGESGEIAQNYQTKVGRERAKVVSFVVGIAEVLGSLMCLYEDPAAMGEGFTPEFSRKLSYSILADSTVLLDANQRLKRINDFVNMYAKSGLLNLEAILNTAASLSGLDPTVVIKVPEPKPPVEPNISLRLTGVEDLSNPMALALLIKSGQAPTPDLIEKAKQLIQQAVVTPPVPPPMEPPAPQEPIPNPGQVPMPSPPVPPVGEANPEMSAMPKITERTEPGGRQ